MNENEKPEQTPEQMSDTLKEINASLQDMREAVIFLTVKGVVQLAAVRALIAAHPHPEQLRSHFDLLVSSYQTHPHTLGGGLENAALLRETVNYLFHQD